MIFDYAVTRTFNQSIDVVDIGNMALQCTNTEGAIFYLLTKTIMGKTSILTFGPVCPDLEMLLDGYSLSYKKIDYKESKIYNEVSKYINDFRKEVSDIIEVTKAEVFEVLPDIETLFEEL